MKISRIERKSRKKFKIDSNNCNQNYKNNQLIVNSKLNCKNSGITLIALVVTIIVLLILAGVTITMLSGQNGVLSNAQKARRVSMEAEKKEQINLMLNAIKTEIFSQQVNNKRYSGLATDSGKTKVTGVDGVITKIIKDDAQLESEPTINNSGKTKLTSEKTIKKGSDGWQFYLDKASVSPDTGSTTYTEEGTLTIAYKSTTSDFVAYGRIVLTNTTAKVEITEAKSEQLSNDGKTSSSTGGDTSSIPEGLKIGDIVTYTPPSATFNWQGKYSGDSSDVTTLDNTKDSYKITSLTVLDINEDDEEVTLISTAPTSGKVYLGGAQGYNNAVKLLKDACGTLYGNTDKGITARSINREDIEKYMSDAGKKARDRYNNGNVLYGVQTGNAYTSNKFYPSIYAQENKSVIDGKEKTGGLGISEQINYVEPKDSGASNGSIYATTSIQPYQTYYYIDMNRTNFSTVTDGNVNNYYYILKAAGNGYWLASRCINIYSSVCGFDVGYVNSGGLDAYGMYGSGNSTSPNSHALRPVVSLSFGLLKKDGNNFKIDN